jgi:hypothetical protein
MIFLQHGFEKWEESQIVIFNLKITNSNPEALGLSLILKLNEMLKRNIII